MFEVLTVCKEGHHFRSFSFGSCRAVMPLAVCDMQPASGYARVWCSFRSFPVFALVYVRVKYVLFCQAVAISCRCR